MKEPASKTTVASPAEFAAICQAHHLTPTQVLSAFMSDLAETDASDDGEERMSRARHAQLWLARLVSPEAPPAGLVYQAESGEWSWVVIYDGDAVCAGAGYATEGEARAAMKDEVDAQVPRWKARTKLAPRHKHAKGSDGSATDPPRC